MAEGRTTSHTSNVSLEESLRGTSSSIIVAPTHFHPLPTAQTAMTNDLSPMYDLPAADESVPWDTFTDRFSLGAELREPIDRAPTTSMSKQAQYARRKTCAYYGVTVSELEVLYARIPARAGTVGWWLALLRLRGEGAVVAIQVNRLSHKPVDVLKTIRTCAVAADMSTVYARVDGEAHVLHLSLAPLPLPRSAFNLQRMKVGTIRRLPLDMFPTGTTAREALRLVMTDRDICVADVVGPTKPFLRCTYDHATHPAAILVARHS